MGLEDIAKRLHVSPATVSRALNPATERLISKPIRDKIKAYAGKTGYVPNRTAQELVKGRTHAIGVVINTSFTSFFFSDHLAKIQAGLYAVMEDHARYTCKLVVLPRGKALGEADQYVLGTGVDGLLISTLCDFAAYTVEDLIHAVQRHWKRPIVALNLDPEKAKGISTVCFSNKAAAQMAVTHLIQKGHRRIGLMYADNRSSDALERIDGYYQALEDHRLSAKPAWIVQGDFTIQSGYQAALQLFRQKGRVITAIFCTNDEMAIGVMRALKVLRLRCPQDVAVMGFDGLALGDVTDPRLSSVAQPTQEIARTGAQLVLDLIEERVKGPLHLTVPSQLILRDSA